MKLTWMQLNETSKSCFWQTTKTLNLPYHPISAFCSDHNTMLWECLRCAALLLWLGGRLGFVATGLRHCAQQKKIRARRLPVRRQLKWRKGCVPLVALPRKTPTFMFYFFDRLANGPCICLVTFVPWSEKHLPMCYGFQRVWIFLWKCKQEFPHLASYFYFSINTILLWETWLLPFSPWRSWLGKSQSVVAGKLKHAWWLWRGCGQCLHLPVNMCLTAECQRTPDKTFVSAKRQTNMKLKIFASIQHVLQF